MYIGAPRVCGDDPAQLVVHRWVDVVLPAYAGMIHVRGAPRGQRGGAPRVCGDDPGKSTYINWVAAVLPAYAGMIPKILLALARIEECSPRMRG